MDEFGMISQSTIVIQTNNEFPRNRCHARSEYAAYKYVYILYMICIDMMYLCYPMFFKHNPLQASSELCIVTVQVGFMLCSGLL